MLKKILFNDGEPYGDVSSREMAARLKRSSDSLQVAFFEPGTGRVVDERIRDSSWTECIFGRKLPPPLFR